MLAVFKDRDLIIHGNPMRGLVSLAVPAVASSLFMVVFEIIDMYWVGKLGEKPVAALSAASFLVWMIRALSQTVGVGGLALISRRTGEKDIAGAQKTILGALSATCLFSFFILILFIPFSGRLFGCLNLETPVGHMASVYTLVFLSGLPFVCLMVTGEHLIRGLGNTRLPMIITGFSLILNAVLDPLFIFHFGLGLAGAAVATVIAQITGCILMLSALIVLFPPLKKARLPAGRIWFKQSFLPMIRIGIPVSFGGAAFSAIYLVLTGIISLFGNAPLAALGIGHRLEAFPFFVTTGLSQATAAMVGQNLGANQPRRARRSVQLSLLLGTILLLAVSVLFFIMPGILFRFFIDSPDVIAHGSRYIRIIAVFEIFMALEVILGGAFSGAGETLPPFLIIFFFTFLRIPLAFLFGVTLDLGVEAVWWAISGTTFLKGTALFILFRRGQWLRKKI